MDTEILKGLGFKLGDVGAIRSECKKHKKKDNDNISSSVLNSNNRRVLRNNNRLSNFTSSACTSKNIVSMKVMVIPDPKKVSLKLAMC